MNDYSKKYFWLKLHRGFFKRHDVKLIRMRHGNDGVIFYLALLCESLDHDGALRFSEGVPYTAEELAVVTETDITADEAEAVFKTLVDKGLMFIQEDGTIVMTKAMEMCGSETGMAKYQRERRAKELTLGLYNNVSMSRKELEQLKEFYPSYWSDYIERLSAHKKAKGAKYDNDQAQIMRWLKEDVGEVEVCE